MSSYECHITLFTKDAEIGRRVAEAHGWKTSEIARDPVLGDDTYFYLTAHSRELGAMKLQMNHATELLLVLGANVVRQKIEHIVFDTKNSKPGAKQIGEEVHQRIAPDQADAFAYGVHAYMTPDQVDAIMPRASPVARGSQLKYTYSDMRKMAAFVMQHYGIEGDGSRYVITKVGKEPVSSMALKLLDSIIHDMEHGFVRCERCGEQESTKDLDFMSMLRDLRELVAAPPPRALGASQPDPIGSNVHDPKPKMNRWEVISDKKILRRLGKSGEEVNELGSVLARCIIQGIDEIDPSSGKTNRLRLEEEIADVYAQCTLNIKHLGLRDSFIERRAIEKMTQMKEWEGLYASPAGKAAAETDNSVSQINPINHEQTK